MRPLAPRRASPLAQTTVRPLVILVCFPGAGLGRLLQRRRRSLTSKAVGTKGQLHTVDSRSRPSPMQCFTVEVFQRGEGSQVRNSLCIWCMYIFTCTSPHVLLHSGLVHGKPRAGWGGACSTRYDQPSRFSPPIISVWSSVLA